MIEDLSDMNRRALGAEDMFRPACHATTAKLHPWQLTAFSDFWLEQTVILAVRSDWL